MPNQPNFPIPDDLTPDTFCLCLQIPNDPTWVQTFVGLLAQPTYWFNWDRDSARSGKTLSQYWSKLFDEIDWSTMSCCCQTPQRRLNSDGTMSVSFDGGATWQPAGDLDPRNTATQLPPVPGSDAPTIKCKAANSIVRQLKDQQAGYSANIGVISTIAEMAASLVGLAILVFFDPALAPFLIGAFFELAAALLATTQTAYNALFTDDDWGWILCEVFCLMDDTGALTQADFVQIESDFDAHFSGNAALTFSSILDAWQLAGLNNASKIPTTDNLDCSGCCAECDPTMWTIFNGAENYGTVVSYGSNYVIADLEFAPSTVGEYYLRMKTPTTIDCCTITGWEVVSGGTLNITVYGQCGEAQTSGGSLSLSPTIGSAGDQVNRFAFAATAATRVKITFG